MKTAGFLHISFKILKPLGKNFDKFSLFLAKLITHSTEVPRYKTSREELKILIELPESRKFVSKDEKKFLLKAFESSEKRVKEIMIPLVDVIAVEINSKIKAVAKIMKEKGVSKLPVYKKRIDNIIGIVTIKTLLFSDPKKDKLEKLVENVFYISENKLVYDLINDFAKNKTDIAIVVDEYGASVGLVTLEDIIEEIIGNIEDEFDKIKAPLIKKINEQTYYIDSKLEIEDFQDYFNVKLKKGEYETIGGFLISLNNYNIPKKGEIFNYKNLQFKIIDANARKINKIEVKLKPKNKKETS